MLGVVDSPDFTDSILLEINKLTKGCSSMSSTRSIVSIVLAFGELNKDQTAMLCNNSGLFGGLAGMFSSLKWLIKLLTRLPLKPELVVSVGMELELSWIPVHVDEYPLSGVLDGKVIHGHLFQLFHGVHSTEVECNGLNGLNRPLGDRLKIHKGLKNVRNK